jgi:glutamyl-tRNA reductase
VPDVTLFDMDDLERFTESSLNERRREVSRVQGIIMDELEQFQTDRTARELAPLVTALRGRGDEIRRAELDRFRAKLDGLDPEARKAVDALTQGIVNKLLHEPTVRLKDAAGTARGELYADALGALFDLPDGLVDDATEG